MADDGSNIVSEIVEEAEQVVGDVGKGLIGEFAKLGKSATSQIRGSTSGASSQPGASGVQKSDSFWDEFKKITQAATGQVRGNPAANENDIAKAAEADREFSQEAAKEVAQRVKQIYEEYEKKRQQERQQQQAVAIKQEEKTKVELEQMKKFQERQQVNPAIAKTRAEIKNYGAE